MITLTKALAPSQLLSDLGIESPADIDIEAIAQYCGATIVYAPLTSSEARILGYSNRAIITVNNASSPERQRFSAGHELGHWMHDRGKAFLSCTEGQLNSEWFKDNPEQRANRYAANLLMPLHMFQPKIEKRPITFSTVDYLASIFRTSLTATAIRLVEHGSMPSMVICSDARKRKWFTRSEILPEGLWPHEAPGRLTTAFTLQRNAAAFHEGPVVVDASQWIDHPAAARFVVTEDSRRITSELVLTLLWWEDERQILELAEAEEEDDSDKDPFE